MAVSSQDLTDGAIPIRYPARMQRFGKINLLWSSGVPGLLIGIAELVLLGLVLGGFYFYQGAIERRGESRDAVEALDNLLIALVDAETGERGYLITGDQAFLGPYQDGLFRIDTQLELVKDYVERDVDNAHVELFNRTTELIAQKVVVLKDSVELMSNGFREESHRLIDEGRGRQLMDEIRTNLGLIRDEEVRLLDSRVRQVDNTGRFIAITAGTLALVTTALVGWLLVTLSRRQEAAALRAAAVAKDEFVGFVSHELRTPIALLQGNVRMLQDAGFGEGDAAVTEALQEISYAADRQEDIVTTLLSLAKAGEGIDLAVEPVLLSRIAESVRRRQQRQHPDLHIEVASEPDTPPALGDRSAIEQVLINLISNANKYGDRSEPIRIGVGPEDGFVRVSVTNSGSTLDEEAFRHIFEPFFRMPATAASAPGIGLGLTVCHRLIAAQGGHMRAEPVDGGGARFTFRLPVARMDYDPDV